MSKLKLSEARERTDFSDALKKGPLRAKYKGDFDGALRAAGYAAQRDGVPMYVYRGNSYMTIVWRATHKHGEPLSRINNTGPVVFVVTPGLAVFQHDVLPDEPLED